MIHSQRPGQMRLCHCFDSLWARHLCAIATQFLLGLWYIELSHFRFERCEVAPPEGGLQSVHAVASAHPPTRVPRDLGRDMIRSFLSFLGLLLLPKTRGGWPNEGVPQILMIGRQFESFKSQVAQCLLMMMMMIVFDYEFRDDEFGCQMRTRKLLRFSKARHRNQSYSWIFSFG
ncbi:hypothetical protein VTO42DRAFT_3154 [Malbranchea cinnamomea]